VSTMSEYTNGEADGNGMETLSALGTDKYGEYDINYGAMPLKVVRQMIRRAVAHVLSNEVSAAVGGEVKDLLESGDISPEDAALDSQYRKDMTHQARLEHIESFYDGTWGSNRRGPRGPRIDSFETEFNRSVADAVRNEFARRKITLNKESKLYEWDAIVNGETVRRTRTLEQAMANYINTMSDAEKAVHTQTANETVAAKQRAAAAKAAAKAALATTDESDMRL
jgi:hypothetical protein